MQDHQQGHQRLRLAHASRVEGDQALGESPEEQVERTRRPQQDGVACQVQEQHRQYRIGLNQDQPDAMAGEIQGDGPVVPTLVLVARTFLVEPKIVLLDEPTAALDPENAVVVRNFIAQQNKQHGTSILFTSHNMAEVADLCNRILVLKEGVIVADNTPEKLAATVSAARVQLVLTSAPDVWHAFAQQENIAYKHEGHHVEIVIDEHEIANLLIKLARAGIVYRQISIEKPTLEDYFLMMARTEGNV